jgi:chloride channel protein, CIC family
LGPIHHPRSRARRVVTFLIVNFAPEARGHGVPEVMDAIHYHEGIIRAVTMIFEMTRDYALVMPSIIAVAVGVRRLLSQESIYTAKLAGRRHFVPKALHANMFLVRPASQVMQSDVLFMPATTDFVAFLRHPEFAGQMKHVVVTMGDRIVGFVRVNMALRSGVEGAYTGVKLGDVAQRNFILAHEDNVVFDVLTRMARRRAAVAIVIRPTGRWPHASDVVGVISREHIGNLVAESIRAYGD